VRIGVVGGGILGLSLAYYLAGRGASVTVFEAGESAGGMLGGFALGGGSWADRFYHCILSSDAELISLIEELGLGERVRFADTRQGLYRQGRLYPLAGARDFLLFPPLSLVERGRLVFTILAGLATNDWSRLERLSVERWLVGLGGRGVFEKLWKPMLRAKFDGGFQQTPATYIWSRLKRMSSTRAAAGQRERMGYLSGGSRVLVDQLVERIESRGGVVRLGVRVERVLVSGGVATGVLAGGEEISFDRVVLTTPLPVAVDLLPEPDRERAGLAGTGDAPYLGIVCGVLVLNRGLTPYYTLNIADEETPFTGLIETTNLIAPEHVGGNHLVYLPKYVASDSPYWRLSDAELRTRCLSSLRRMFPSFDEGSVRDFRVFRERFVEPLHLIGRTRPTVPMATGLAGAFIVNSGQIYPDLTNCQASVKHALRAAPVVLGSGELAATTAGAGGKL
jgi:protoporphyrinogen oxidase